MIHEPGNNNNNNNNDNNKNHRHYYYYYYCYYYNNSSNNNDNCFGNNCFIISIFTAKCYTRQYNFLWLMAWYNVEKMNKTFRSNLPDVFLGKYILQQIYKRTPIPKFDFNKLQSWNHISTSVFSCKFAAYFQNNSP